MAAEQDAADLRLQIQREVDLASEREAHLHAQIALIEEPRIASTDNVRSSFELKLQMETDDLTKRIAELEEIMQKNMDTSRPHGVQHLQKDLATCETKLAAARKELT